MTPCTTPRVAPRVVQIAYHVPDPAAAAADCARRYGWGPFYLLEHVPLASCRYRGVEAAFDHTSAYGQAGDLMVELITQHGDAQSVIREAYAADESGVHHMASFVADLDAAVAHYAAHGGALVMDAQTADGVRFAMVEVPLLGHYLELYEATPALTRFYDYIRKKSLGWDGTEPVRRFR